MERDEHFARLQASDPAKNAEFDADAMWHRIDARTTSESNTAGMPIRGTNRALQYLAVAAALAVFAGGGYATGMQRAGSANDLAATSLMAPGDANAKMGGAGGLGGAGGPETLSASSSYATWYGNTILKPATSVPNLAGTAPAIGFDDAALDRTAFAKQLAQLVGLDPARVKAEEYYIGFSEQDGVSVELRPQAGFWVNANDRSPWSCGVSTNPEPRPATEQERIDADCKAAWPRPTDADALSQAKALLQKLSLPSLSNAEYSIGWSDDRSVSVVATPKFEGITLRGLETTVVVGTKGPFSLNGSAARIVKVGAYPVDGARDVALRSTLRKWAAFGPSNVSSNAGVMPMEGVAPSTPVTLTRNGLPMPQAMLAEVEVVSAQAGLQLMWFPGGETVFLPTWDYTARDGSLWQMLAISEDYIDWSSPTINPPLMR